MLGKILEQGKEGTSDTGLFVSYLTGMEATKKILECDKNGFVKSNDDRIFKMEKNKLYFCEFKNSLKSLEYEKKLIDKGKKGIKGRKEFLKSLINKCKKFRNLYINEFSIDKDAEVNIIIFYDDTISDTE